MSAGNAFVGALLDIIYIALNFYIWILIIGGVLSWLIAFGVVNSYNRFVGALLELYARITEPLLRPIRRFLPNMGAVDLSPLVLIFVIFFLQSFIRRLVF